MNGVATFNWTQQDLDELSAWLKSPDGQQAFRDAQECIEREGAKILAMRDISPEVMRTPFYIPDMD